MAHTILAYDDKKCVEYREVLENQTQQQQSLDFLLACKRYGIIPSGITGATLALENRFKNSNLKRRFKGIEHDFHQRILSLEIAQTKDDLKANKKILCKLCSELSKFLTPKAYEIFALAQEERMQETAVKIRQKEQQELAKLKEKSFIEMGFYFEQNWFENRTEIDIPWECKWLLALGKDFALPIDKRKLPALEIIAQIEVFIQEINAANKHKIATRKKLVNKISEFKLTNKQQTKREKFILAVFKDTKDFLARHKNIIITRTYEDGKTIAIHKQEYESQIKELLEDRNTYRICRTDPTSKLINKNNAIIAALYKKKKIDINMKNTLHCSAAVAPRMEVLPLIYKAKVIMKPTLAFSSQAPGYQLCKFVQAILENIVSSQYNVKSTLELKQQLEKITIEENECLAAFKVKSLFGNLPLRKVTEILSHKWHIIRNHTQLTRSQFREIRDFCLYNNRYFVYAHEVFNQTTGLPIGHLLTPIVADIFMDNLVEATLAKLSKLNIYIRYVAKNADHILALIKAADKEEIFDTLNGHHAKIKFTAKFEPYEKIIFLEAKLHREDNVIRFDWHVPDNPAAGAIINYNATLAKTQIINAAKNLMQNVFAISDKQFHEQNVKKVYEILTKQSFPKRLAEFLCKSHKTTAQQATPQAGIKYWLKYIPGLTDPKSLSAIIGAKSTKFGYEACTTLSEMFSNSRTPVDKLQQHHVVYEIPCQGKGENSCHLVYIGITKRNLKTRMNEHKAAIRNYSESTALTQHIKQTNHVADFDNVQILDIENNEKKLGIKEGLRIQQKLNRTMNIKKDSDKAGAIYRAVL